MAANDILTDLQDDDILVIYRDTKGPGRRKSSRILWSTVAHTVLAAQPTVRGEQGVAGRDGLPGKDGAPGTPGTPGKDGSPGKDGLPGKDGAQGIPGTPGKDGVNGKDGAAGAPGAPRRIERYTGTVVGTNGIATITFPTAFAAPPLGDVVTTWDGPQMVTGQVTNTTTTTATVKVMKSVGTLLLNSAPFGVAPAGQIVTIDVFGN